MNDRERANAAILAERPEAVNEWPKPAAPEAFYGLAGDIARSIEPHSESDRMALLMNTLIYYGNVVGRGAYSVAERDCHHMNESCIEVGLTSKGRKGSAVGWVREAFDLVDPNWTRERIKSGLSSGEGLIYHVRDPLGEDAGIDDKRLLILQTEFGAALKVLGRDGNTLSPTIRDAWDSGKLNTLTRNNPLKATGAHISILGHITVDELRRYFSETEQSNGFANRFLFVCVRRSKCLPEGGRFSWDEYPELLERLRRAVEFGRETRQIRRDAEAKAAWGDLYPKLSEGQPGLFGAVTARAEAHVLRLSLIYACLDRSEVVRLEHLAAGTGVWDYCENSCRYIFGNRVGDPIADAILAALREPTEGLTRTEISALFGRHVSAGRTSAALASLQALGRVRAAMETTPGRSAERWLLC